MNRLAVTGVVGGIVVVGISIAWAMGVLPASEKQSPFDRESSSVRYEEKGNALYQDGGAGIEALAQAAREKKYLFAFFWKDESSDTTNLRKVFEESMEKVKERANFIKVCISDSSEGGIIKKFKLQSAPMPLVLAIAPNGAIMGGFPQSFDEEKLLNAFGTPSTEQCMKSMTDGNLVLLCVQNKSTTSNEEAMKGVKEFAADPKFSSATNIVVLDPSDPAEKPFLTDLKIDPQTTEAITAFMAPPGLVIAEIKGATDKAELVAALQKASSGCGSGGCGPGGCGPQK
jgi:hypothetical protein